MTIGTTSNKISYDGNGSTVAFAFPFRIFSEADLRVILRAADGVETVQTLTTHYAISASPWTSGGTVTMVTAPAVGQTLVIKTDVSATQGVDYLAADRFPAETHEGALDKLTLLIQQLAERLGRAPVLQETTAIVDFVIPDPETNQILVWDGSAFGWVAPSSLSPGTVLVSTFAETLLDDTAATQMLTTLGVTAFAKTLLDDADAPAARATLGVPRLTGGNVLAPHAGLVLSRPSTTTVDVDAAAVLLTDASGDQKRFASLNVTIDITTNGAAGLDTGAAANAWYYVWALGKEDGTVTAVLSTAASLGSITLPTDYLYGGIVGMALRASGALVDFKQMGTRVGSVAGAPLSAGAAASFTAIALANYVPPLAKVVHGDAQVLGATTTEANGYLASDGSGTTPQYQHTRVRVAGTGLGAFTALQVYSPFSLLLTTPQQIKYYVGSATMNVVITGWEY